MSRFMQSVPPPGHFIVRTRILGEVRIALLVRRVNCGKGQGQCPICYAWEMAGVDNFHPQGLPEQNGTYRLEIVDEEGAIAWQP